MMPTNILSVFLILSVNVAFAAGPSPKASIPEQAGRVGLESALSIVAATITHAGCSLGFFTLDVDAEADGSAAVTLDGVSLNVGIDTQSAKGYLWNVTGGGIYNDVMMTDYIGGYGTDYEGIMLYGSADMLLSGIAYGKHIIEDFWLKDPAAQNHSDVLADGLEIITKLDFPRAKWIQDSFYHRPNGGDGSISVTKTQIAPDSTNLCSLTYSALVDDFADGWVTRSGILIVVPQVVNQSF